MEKYVFKEEVEEKALPLKDRLECDEVRNIPHF